MKRLVVVLMALLPFGCVAHAQFRVDQVDARRVDDNIQVKARLDLSLTDATEDALSHGVPLIVVNEIELNRNGWFWDRTVQRVSERHELRYHALSGQYVVDSDGIVLDTFRSISDALEFINSISASFKVPDKDTDYNVAVRSRIDINALPAPLRPTALFSPQWQLSSDWSQWPIDVSSIN